MHIKEKKRTHTSRKKKEYELDQQFFLKKANITEADYYNYILEVGCSYAEVELKNMFPNWKGERLQEIFNRVLFKKWYWNWFRTEWKSIQHEVIKNVMCDSIFVKDRKSPEIFVRAFNFHMQYQINSAELSTSFYHLLERNKW